MKFNKVHCLFEQSGTFKHAFEKLGFEAFDYDIEISKVVKESTDIFKHIFVYFNHLGDSLFNKISKDDLVMAFFPCTYFSDQSQLLSRGDNYGQRKWDLSTKLEFSIYHMAERTEYYKKLCMLCHIALQKGFKLIIENPYGKVNFLKQFFPIKPAVIIKNRTEYGDYYKKPTQFFYINCEKPFHLENVSYNKNAIHTSIEDVHGFSRSVISSQFADNFIKNFILD